MTTTPQPTPAAPHKCPVCDGQGKVSRPPGIAGDQHEWPSSDSAPHTCRTCNGAGVLWPQDFAPHTGSAVPADPQPRTPIEELAKYLETYPDASLTSIETAARLREQSARIAELETQLVAANKGAKVNALVARSFCGTKLDGALEQDLAKRLASALDKNDAIRCRIAELERVNGELNEDRERLDWLQSSGAMHHTQWDGQNNEIHCICTFEDDFGTQGIDVQAPTIRAAIDAARKERA